MPSTDTVVLPVIASMGVSIWDPIWARNSHHSRANELVHIIRGSLRAHIDGRIYDARAGDTLFVPTGVLHRDEFPLHSRFEALLLQFSWRDTRLLPAAADNALLSRLPSRCRRELGRKIREVYEAFQHEDALAAELTRALLYGLLLCIKAMLTAPAGSAGASRSHAHHRHAELLALARRYVTDHIERPISLGDIAAHLGLSAYHLSHIFSRTSGFSLSSYITQTRMERSRELLNDPRMRVSEVAYAVGYTDPNHFAKSFRRYFGCSPSRLRSRQAAGSERGSR